jgi:cell division transport system permease protein
MGATDRYVRLPFLIEGTVEALMGMIVALVALHFLANFADGLAGDLISLIGAANLVRLPSTTVALLLAGSALTGLTGAGLSLRGLARV